MAVSRPRSRLRLQAAASIVLFAGALLAAGYHQATVIHGYCSEHGRRIHIDARTPHRPAVAPTQRALRVAIVARGVHDCPALLLLAQPYAEAGRRCPGAVMPPSVYTAAGQLRRQHRVIALLRLSPKASPPRV